MKTKLTIPEISLQRATMPSLSRSKVGSVSNKSATQILKKLYANASYVFYTADERKIDEAKRKHGDSYLIKLFPRHPRLVLRELQTISQERFRELYNDFVIKYEKDLPNIRKTIKELREKAMELKRYKRYEESSKYSDLVQELSPQLKKLTGDFIAEVEGARNRTMAAVVYKRGTRKNGSPLSRLHGPHGNKTLSKIQSYL